MTEDNKTINGSLVPHGANLTIHTTGGTIVEVPMAKITDSFARRPERL